MRTEKQRTNPWQPAPFATSYMVGREEKRTNNRTMLPTLKNNAAAGYQGPVKIELLKDADLLTNYGNIMLLVNLLCSVTTEM